MGLTNRLRNYDFFRKIPKDLTETSFSGAILSLVATGLIAFLVISETADFVRPRANTELVIDRSAPDEFLRVNLEVSFPALPCDFLELDVSDAVGTRRYNLSQTIVRIPINQVGKQAGSILPDSVHKKMKAAKETGEEGVPARQLQEAADDDTEDGRSVIADLPDENAFNTLVMQHPIVMINFYAPWCPWSRKLTPAWDEAALSVFHHHRNDGTVRLGKVDCVKLDKLCEKYNIMAFPSIRIFRRGTDELDKATHQHASYYGDRSATALVSFAEKLLDLDPVERRRLSLSKLGDEAGQLVVPMQYGGGCSVQGFVLVKRVPGSLTLALSSDFHTIHAAAVNTTHNVNSFYYGPPLSASRKQREAVARLHPQGFTDEFLNRLKGMKFLSDEANVTHEHYMSIVATNVEPPAVSKSLTLFEYTLHSHSYVAPQGTVPLVRFTYDLSPVVVLISERHRPLFRFVTSLMAIVGGCYTAASMLDSGIHEAKQLRKKLNLGKQG